MMTVRRFVPALVVALTFCGCGLEGPAEEKDDGEAPTAPFLSLSEFASTSLRTIEAQFLGNQLNGDPDFLADPDDEAGDDDDDGPSACDAMMGEPKVSASADQLTLGFNLDMTDCTAKDVGSDDGDDVEAVTLKMFVDFRCVGGDLSVYDGKSLDELGTTKIDPCIDAGGTQSSALVQMEAIYRATFMIQKQAGSAEKEEFKIDSRTIDHSGASESEGCGRVAAADGTISMSGACLAYNLEHVSSDPGNDTLRKLTKSGLTFKEGDVFFATGKIDIDLNGWQGSLVYTSPTAEPTWTLSKGGETETGTVSEDHKAGGEPEKATDPADYEPEKASDDSGADETSPSSPLHLTGGRRHAAPAPRLPPALRKMIGPR